MTALFEVGAPPTSRKIHDDIEGPDLDRQEMLAWCVQTSLETADRSRLSGTQERWWLPYASSEEAAMAAPIASGLLVVAPTAHSVPDVRLLPCLFLQTFPALEMSYRQNRSASSFRN